jgi:hypothetical protein
MDHAHLRTHPRVDLNNITIGMVVVYDPMPATGNRYAMRPGTLGTVAGPSTMYDPGYYEVEFIQPLEPKVPPRNGQSDGAYHMRDFRVVVASVPKFTTASQAQAWLDQHSGE